MGSLPERHAVDEVQIVSLLEAGRLLSPSWRSFNASIYFSNSGTGTDSLFAMDHYAADAFAVVEALDLRNVVHIGHSTGGGEVARYVTRHGQPSGCVAKAVLVWAVPPLMLRTDANPDGLPIDVFDGFRAVLAANRAQFFRDVPSGPFYGFNRAGSTPQEGVVRNWGRQGMMGGAPTPITRVSKRFPRV